MTITAAELLVRVGADTSDAEGGLKSFSSKMKGIAGQMAGVGTALGLGISGPLVGLGVTAVKTAATFERSMNVLGQVSGATGKQLQQMSDQALQLGADTVFSSNEAASGMVELAKAGLTTTQVMKAIPGVMDLAAAGAIGVEEAANLTAATLNTFGLEASKSAEVADILAAAANASAADITDLAFGVQNAGSIFASSGQSVQTLATMMALLANNGLNASDAATSLKTMTLRLTAPTAQAAKLMKQMGIAVFNADGSMRDYHDIIVDLSKASSGLSDQQRSLAFNTIFGTDALRAANILTKEGAKGYEDMAKAVGQQGAAAAMANAQNSGLSGAMEQISGSIESLMTKLALPFLPTISSWLMGLTEFVNGLGTLSPAVINATLAFAGFAAALGVVMLAGAGIAGVIGALATPVGLVTLAVIGLAAATAGLWVAWQSNWGNIQGTMQPFTDALITAGMAAQDFVRFLMQASVEGDVFNAWLLSVPPAFVPIAEATARAMIALQDFGRYLVAVVVSGAALNIWLFTLSPAVAAVALALGNGIVALQQFAAGVSSAATSVAVLLAFNPQWQTLVGGVQGAAAALSDLATHPASIATNMAVILALNPQWQTLVGNIKDAASAISGFATSLAAGAISFAVLLALNPQWQGFIQNIKDAAAAVSTFATNMAAAVVNFKLPDLKAGLGALKSNVDFQVNATVKTLLKPPQLTIMPFPAMTIPPPPITVQPLKPVTFAAPKPDSAAGGLADIPGKILDNLTAQISGGDWAGVGHLLGSVIVANWNAEIAKIGPLLSFVGMIGAFGTAFNQFQVDFVAALIGFGVAVGSTGIAAKIAALGVEIGKAIQDMWTNVMSTIAGAFASNTDATSTSDVLRERALGPNITDQIASFGSALVGLVTTIHEFTWPGTITDFKWPDTLTGFTWPTVLTAFAWPIAIAAFAWPGAIAAFAWPLSLAFSWSEWIDHLDWGRYISGIFGSAGTTAPSTGGGGGGGFKGSTPQAMGTSYFRGGTALVGEHGPELVRLPQGSQIYSNGELQAGGAGSGIHIVIQNVAVHNGMDIEQLVATIARRLQQKMRL